MDSPETHEPSYYEVALTNRQVLIAFVALLTCLLVAFLSGVWIGRGGAEAAQLEVRPPAQAAAAAEPPLEQLSFFNGTDPGKPAPKPVTAPSTSSPAATPPAGGAAVDPAPAAPSGPAPDASDAMRQNLEATMAANRDTPAMKLAVGERTGAATAAAPERATEAAPKPVAPTPAKPEAKAPATGRTFVQVYSSSNGPRAQEIAAQLRKAGFTVAMAETAKAGGKNYRVRVGPYETRAAAEAAAIRLRRDHRLDTWVTDSP